MLSHSSPPNFSGTACVATTERRASGPPQAISGGGAPVSSAITLPSESTKRKRSGKAHPVTRQAPSPGQGLNDTTVGNTASAGVADGVEESAHAFPDPLAAGDGAATDGRGLPALPDDDEAYDMPDVGAGQVAADANPGMFSRMMTEAIGDDFNPETAKFLEESRAEPTLDDDIKVQYTQKKKQNKALKEACAIKDSHINKALGIMGTLTDQLLSDRFSKLDYERMIAAMINDLLFKGTFLNLSPAREDFMARILVHAGFKAESDDADRFQAFLNEKGIPGTVERRFNNRMGKLYHEFRLCLRKSPFKLLKPKRVGRVIRFEEPLKFALDCAAYVAIHGTRELGIDWHIWNTRPFSSPAFMECAKQFALAYDPTKAIALHPDQLLIILAVVRFKLRNPTSRKLRLTWSGDSEAMRRQALVVQRWINMKGHKQGNFIGIGNICIVGWQEIPAAELEADVLGDEDSVKEEEEDEVFDEEEESDG
ncbi:unnamed protein product [Closterium sp. Naga37s-1]|nr:unnamed protein product [Closterium sp. Naga37s-1]